MNLLIGYKINTQKSLAFLYTNNEISKREIKETIPFTTVTKRIKYLGINLPKEATDWFQIGKGVHQGCIWSPCLYNLYAEYIK